MMRQQDNEGNGKIRQRLVGAVVLIALASIIVPALLDFRQDYDTVIVGSNIPAKPDNFRLEVLKFDAPATIPDVSGLAALEDPVSAEADQPENDETLPQPSGQDAAGEMSTDTVGESARTVSQRLDEIRTQGGRAENGSISAGSGGPTASSWAVQLASLSHKQNAFKLRDRVRGQGYAAFVLSGQVDGQLRYRVLVGPELLRSRAETMRDQLVDKINLKGIVVRYP